MTWLTRAQILQNHTQSRYHLNHLLLKLHSVISIREKKLLNPCKNAKVSGPFYENLLFEEILSLLQRADTDTAIQKCLEWFPGVILNHMAPNDPPNQDMSTLESSNVTFQLRCQHFIELVRQNRQTDALHYAQTIFEGFGESEKRHMEALKV